jgi:hypothetical protein
MPKNAGNLEARAAIELTTPIRHVSYNLPYGFKAARSAHRVRHGPRPGLRSCLRPAPARPAPVPHAASRHQARMKRALREVSAPRLLDLFPNQQPEQVPIIQAVQEKPREPQIGANPVNQFTHVRM